MKFSPAIPALAVMPSVKILCIVIVSFIFMFVIPLAIARYEGVDTLPRMTERLESIGLEKNLPKTFERIKEHEKEKEIYGKVISEMDDCLLNQRSGCDKPGALLDQRMRYKKELTDMKAPVAITYFWASSTMYYHLVLAALLSICVFLVNPQNTGIVKISKEKWFWVVFVGTIGIWAGIQFPSLLRNTSFQDFERNTLAYAHFDIAKISFWYDQIKALGIAFLIIILCCQWFIYYERIVKNTKEWDQNINQKPDIQEFTLKTNHLLRMFSSWQSNILVLMLAFVPYSFIYLDKRLDNRFILSAILMCAGWIFIWSLVSAPIVRAYYKWIFLKNNLLSFLSAKYGGRDKEILIEFIKDSNPLSNVQIIGAGIASIISFCIPMINLFLK